MTIRSCLVYLLFYNSLFIAAGKDSCRVTIDELATISPGRTSYGLASHDHCYYVALKWTGCSPSDKPSLSSYTLVSLRIDRNDQQPMKVSFFDFQRFAPQLKAEGQFKSGRTKFSEMTPRILLGDFPSGFKTEKGVVVNWASPASATSITVTQPQAREKFNEDFVSIFLLMKYNKNDDEFLKRMLSMKILGPSRRPIPNPSQLPSLYDDDWRRISSSVTQVVAISTSESSIKTSSILKGLRMDVKDFVVLSLPKTGNQVLTDVPKGKSLRNCGGKWMMTRQRVGEDSASQSCVRDEMTNILTVPSDFEWSNDFFIGEEMSQGEMQSGGEDMGETYGREEYDDDVFESDGEHRPGDDDECSPNKRRRIESLVDGILFRGGKPYSTKLDNSDESTVGRMFNNIDQIEKLKSILGLSSEILSPLTKRQLYFEHGLSNMEEMSTMKGVSHRHSGCEELIDFTSFIVFGSVGYSKELRTALLRHVEWTESGEVDDDFLEQRWSQTDHSIKCHGLYRDLSQVLKMKIMVYAIDEDGDTKRRLFPGAPGDTSSPPLLVFDGDQRAPYKYLNGVTDHEYESMPTFVESPPFHYVPESTRSGTEGEMSEVLRLTQDTHRMVSGMVETCEGRKKYLEMKMKEVRKRSLFLRRTLNEKKKNEIEESGILTRLVLDGLVKNNNLRYIDITFDPTKKIVKFVCGACSEYGLAHIDRRRSIEWTLAPDTPKNNVAHQLDNLRSHHSTQHHQEAAKEIDARFDVKMNEVYSSNLPDPGITPTRMMLNTAYYGTHLGIAVSAFPSLCQMQRVNGLRMGFKNTGRSAFTRAVEMIGRSMKKQLIAHLVNNRIPFGLQLDTSTDSQGRKVLLVFISAFIDGYPREMFYAAIVPPDETGLTVFKSVIDRFEADGWLNHLHKYLIGISTDGAKSMLSEDKGFGGRLISYLEEVREGWKKRRIPNTIPHFHCAGHRIELAIKDVFEIKRKKGDPEVVTWSEATTAVINQMNSFYSSISTKRVESLHQTAIDQKLSGSADVFLKIKRVFAVRWTSSALASRRAFARMYKTIWENLAEYDNDITKLTGSSRADERNLAFRARTFLMIMQNIRFYSHLTFEIGILECTEFLSLEAQRTDSTLIDFPKAFAEFELCVMRMCADPFDPYTPVVRESKRRHSGREKAIDLKSVPYMHNVIVLDEKGEQPAFRSVMGKYALQGERSASIDSLKFRLDFTPQAVPSAQAIARSKDTIFNSLHPLPSRRSQTPDRDEVAPDYQKERKAQQDQAQAELDREKDSDSRLFQKFVSAKFTLLDKNTRSSYGRKMVQAMRTRFYDETLEWAASYTVKKMLFSPTPDPDEAADKANRKKLADLFHLDANDIEDDIKAMKNAFMTELSYAERTRLEQAPTDVVLFHTQMTGKSIYGEELESMISVIITLPINSAGVERGFSIYNNFMSKRRSSLIVPHLEDYLTIHINGPNPEHFKPERYEKEWLKSGRHPTEIRQEDEEDEEAEGDEDDEEGDFDFMLADGSFTKRGSRITIFD